MQPVHFDLVNCIYKAPQDWNEAEHGPCKDLPARREDGNVTSRWRPSYEELQALLAGGAIELTIHGGQPAVALRVV